ncbi:hypothetical protein HPB51_027787 [Rhipicephalus microplus]|uniref:Uncharacterized protein n=1 Tax=Rhipicephalus microplus TaxID=6941 RepID=A0A9J6CZ66_RHIMP|nr:hypothetical protein HPB51_027787 [Rhipicephalus microplus]
MACMEDPHQQSFYGINWTGEEQKLKRPRSTPKLEKGPRKTEDQGIANLEQVEGSRRDGGRCGISEKNEDTQQYYVNNQLMKRAKEEPTDSLSTSNNGFFDLLGGEAGSSVFPMVSSLSYLKPGPQESVSLGFEKLDDAATKQDDGHLKAKEPLTRPMIIIFDFLARYKEPRLSFSAEDTVGLAVVSITSDEVLDARSRFTRAGREVLGLSG